MVRPSQSRTRAVPLGVALGEVVVDRDQVGAAAFERVEVEWRAAAISVLPSPVFSSAILPWCRTMRADELDVVRRAGRAGARTASRTTAKASGRRSSSVSPSARRWRNSSVLARSSSSERAWDSGSRSLISSASGHIFLSSRSLPPLNIFPRKEGICVYPLVARAWNPGPRRPFRRAQGRSELL